MPRSPKPKAPLKATQAKAEHRRALLALLAEGETFPAAKGLDHQAVLGWHLKLRHLLGEAFGEKSSTTVDVLMAGEIAMFAGSSDYQTDQERAKSILARLPAQLPRLRYAIDLLSPGDGTPSPGDAGPAIGPSPEAIADKRVFVVHGHDRGLRDQVEVLLRKLRCDPIILDDQASGGNTVIEKFEEYVSGVAFAVVLLTADDVGRAKAVDAKDEKARARQNVIFEMGFFYAHLGRKHVAALLAPGVEEPSDIKGVVYVSAGGADWPSRLVKEMKRAGLDVSADDL